MEAVAVLHHDEPASQLVGRTDSAGRHWRSGRKTHLFHEYGAIREVSVFPVGGDSSGRRIDDMKLLRTLSLVAGHRPRAQELIRGSIGGGHMQIPFGVGYGLGFQLAVCSE